MPPPPAHLVDDLVEAVLLRFPPGDPAALVCAALVCKRWRRLVSGASFRRRFREFHRTPPMLGVFCWNEFGLSDRRFVPTTAFRLRHAEGAHIRVLDARHGRVLFTGDDLRDLVVWDPITDEEWEVPFPLRRTATTTWSAAVLCSTVCAGGGCGHLDCHRGPFTVVFAGTVWGEPVAGETFVCAYTSDNAAWSEPLTWGWRPGYFVDLMTRSALLGKALYFCNMTGRRALKYNLVLHQMSWIALPNCLSQLVLTTMEDGGLGLTTEHGSKLYVWSMKDADEVGAARWEQNRVIKLHTLLPVGTDFTSLSVVGSMDDLNTIFVSTKDVAYAIDLKTYKLKKVYEGTTMTIVPYMSFYTPDLEAACAAEGPSVAQVLEKLKVIM